MKNSFRLFLSAGIAGILSLVLPAFVGPVHGQVAPTSSPAPAAGKIVVLGSPADPKLLEAAKAAGLEAGTDAAALAEADVIVLVGFTDQRPDERKKQVEAVTAAVKAGKTFILSAGVGGASFKDFDSILPVNTWSVDKSANRGRMWRYGCGAIAAAASPLAAGFDANGLRLSGRYDLHLPYAAIEAGEHRYQWQTYGKDILNTDWQVHLYCDKDGRLPLLVSGRVGPGKVFVFAGDLYDPDLVAWAGYGQFVKALLTAAGGHDAGCHGGRESGGAVVREAQRAEQPRPATAAEANVVASGSAEATPDKPLRSANHGTQELTLKIARHQPDGLAVEVCNGSKEGAVALLAYKVRNSERALLNSATAPVKVAAGATVKVPLQERSELLGSPAIAASAEAVPYRHIDAAVVSTDRSTVLAEASAIVDTCPAVTLEIQGQDVRSFDDLKTWPERANGPGTGVSGGCPIYRYVYMTGMSPALRVVLRNGLHNIAPLAVAKDEMDANNLTAQGLNDLATSYGSLRGTYPLYGAWTAAPGTSAEVSLAWNEGVMVAGQEIIGRTNYRQGNKGNPANYKLLAGDLAKNVVLTERKDANFDLGRQQDRFGAASVARCFLAIGPIDEKAKGEQACSITEWEVLGWPSERSPAKAEGDLKITATDPLTGKSDVLLQEKATVDALGELVKDITLPAKADFGPVRIDAVFTAGGKDVAKASFDVLFVPSGREAILPTSELEEAGVGLLCSPGFIFFDDFGLGTNADTGGWGGDDDKTWALTHDFMELGRNVTDVANRMFTTSGRFCHYTCPWRDFPSGQYYWDYASDQIEKMITDGKFKGKKKLRIFLSDRWNGIPVGATFTWADYIRFDEYLKSQGLPGLKGQSRKQIANEICTQYGDKWQVWQMNRYADKLIAIQDRLAKIGVSFCVTTHGSFPLAGGELGQKLARTHKAVGTDLFWELRNEDLYYSIGSRFGLIAANPDLQSGAYNEWGWVSAVLNNPHWYAETGTVEPSRRQWYSTYFAGRVDSNGSFHPLHMYGFDAQGAFGVKNTANDWQNYYRTMELATKVRPEAPAGFGLVASWRWQERRMGPAAGDLGFGLYGEQGKPQVDQAAGEVYQKLVKAGVPISFVTSTHCLKKWNGTNPLIVVDAYNLEPWELDELARLNKAGVPIIGVGEGEGAGSDKAADLFGARFKDGNYSPVLGAEAVFTSGGVSHRGGRGATVFCPVSGSDLTGEQSGTLAIQTLSAAGNPLDVPTGIAATTFVSNGNLFLALGDQGDIGRELAVSVRPAKLAAGFDGQKFKVIDMDRSVAVPAKWEQDKLTFTLPAAASDGRLVMIVKE